MKTRQGFVSNSSSSSFIIMKYGLTELQLEAVKNYRMVFANMAPNSDFAVSDLCDWDMTEDEDRFRFHADMDNIRLGSLFDKIGIKTDHSDEDY